MVRLGDRLPLLLLLLIPILIQLPAILGSYSPDPLPVVAAIGDTGRHHPGIPWIDPNVGFQAQALGKLSADQWLAGHIPWWNSYNGVGLPLAAEAQPASLFLPFILIMHFRNGGLWLKVLLQIIAGLCTYALLRKIGFTRTAAFAGAILFEFNGTFGWHGAPINTPVAFLPMLILGLEQLRSRVTSGLQGGWLLIPIALACSIFAGFPETAYIDGLFAGVWALSRFPGLAKDEKFSFSLKIFLGLITGMMISIPLVVPFFEYVNRSFIGNHEAFFAHDRLPYAAIIQSLVPCLYGPLSVFAGSQNVVSVILASIGGYTTALEVFVAFLGVVLLRRWLSVALLAWIIACILKSYDVRPVSDLINLIPMIKSAAFFRYSSPSWEFAIAILAAAGIDGLQRGKPLPGSWIAALFTLVLLGILGGLWLARVQMQSLLTIKSYAPYFHWSMGWLIFSMAAALVLVLMRQRGSLPVKALVVVLAVDACVAFALPMRSGSSHLLKQENGIAFLQAHVGLDRVYSLGPMAPNYGAYFGISQINYNYLPVSQDWVDYIHRHINEEANPIWFIGTAGSNANGGNPGAFVRNGSGPYEELGVKYIMAPPGVDPFMPPREPTANPHGKSEPLQLASNQSIAVGWDLPVAGNNLVADGIDVVIGNYRGRSDGILKIQICDDAGACAEGQRDLAGSVDNAPIPIKLDKLFSLSESPGGTSHVTATISHLNGSYPVALWLMKADPARQVSVRGKPSDLAPSISLRYRNAAVEGEQAPVYAGSDMDIYELKNPRPYFQAIGGSCKLEPSDRNHLTSICGDDSYLLRREAFYPGWRVSIDGRGRAVEETHEIFQGTPLPAGKHSISFSYTPTHGRLIFASFAAGILVLMWGMRDELARALSSRRRAKSA